MVRRTREKDTWKEPDYPSKKRGGRKVHHDEYESKILAWYADPVNRELVGTITPDDVVLRPAPGQEPTDIDNEETEDTINHPSTSGHERNGSSSSSS